MSNQKYPIRDDWEEYYKFLEALRRTGVCNMYGAGIYLIECFNIPNSEARNILSNWMENYDELSDKYDWTTIPFNKVTD